MPAGGELAFERRRGDQVSGEAVEPDRGSHLRRNRRHGFVQLEAVRRTQMDLSRVLEERPGELGQFAHSGALTDPFAPLSAVGGEDWHSRRVMPCAQRVQGDPLRHERLEVIEPQDWPHARHSGLWRRRQQRPQTLSIRRCHQAELAIVRARPERLKQRSRLAYLRRATHDHDPAVPVLDRAVDRAPDGFINYPGNVLRSVAPGKDLLSRRIDTDLPGIHIINSLEWD